MTGLWSVSFFFFYSTNFIRSTRLGIQEPTTATMVLQHHPAITYHNDDGHNDDGTRWQMRGMMMKELWYVSFYFLFNSTNFIRSATTTSCARLRIQEPTTATMALQHHPVITSPPSTRSASPCLIAPGIFLCDWHVSVFHSNLHLSHFNHRSGGILDDSFVDEDFPPCHKCGTFKD